MKRTEKKIEPKKLVLNRESIKVLDDDALQQTRGAGAFSTSKFHATYYSNTN